MFPSFEIFGKTISTYSAAAAVGTALAVLVAYCAAEKKGLDGVTAIVLLIIAFASSLIGSHLLYGIVNWRLIWVAFRNLDKLTSFKVLLSWLVEIFGGAVFYGGLVTGILGGFIYLKAAKKDTARYADIGAFAIPLLHGFGRIGCFLSGCCYGIESSFGFTYTHSLVESANGVCRFPVQLFESGANFILFALFLTFFLRDKLKGKLLPVYLIAYPVCRFILEFYRGDAYRGFIGVLSTSQFISLILIPAGIAMLTVSVAKQKKRSVRP